MIFIFFYFNKIVLKLKYQFNRNQSGLNNTALPVVCDTRGLPIRCSTQTQYYPNQTNSISSVYQSTLSQFVWLFFWLIFLFFISFPLALISTFIYSIVCPISVIWSNFSSVTNSLVQITQLPTYATRNIIDSKALLFQAT